MTLDNSASHSSPILIGQLKQKPTESCQKDVIKLSQTKRKLCSSGDGTTRSTITSNQQRNFQMECRCSRIKILFKFINNSWEWTKGIIRRCYTRQGFMLLVSQWFKSCALTALRDQGCYPVQWFLQVLVTMATTEDSRELTERFSWLMNTNCCETSCTNCCEGCYIGQCSKKPLLQLLQKVEFSFSQQLWQKNLWDVRCGVTLDNFARQVERNTETVYVRCF